MSQSGEPPPGPGTGSAPQRALDFRRLFEGIPGQYLVLDPTYTIVAVSDAYLIATMTTRDDIVGRGILDVSPHHPSKLGAAGMRSLRRSLQRVRDQHVPDVMEVQRYAIRRPAAQGSGFVERFWRPRNVPVFDSGGQLICIVHRLEDVSNQVLVGLQVTNDGEPSKLRESSKTMAAGTARSADVPGDNEEHAAATRARDEFLSRLSHELRTPLSTILGFAELLALRPLGREPRKYVETIGDAGKHLLRLVNDLLDVLRLESGAMPVRLEAVDLGSLISESRAAVHHLAVTAAITVTDTTGASALFVAADRERLRQVVVSLLSNAIQRSQSGGRVSIRAQPSASARERLEIVVADSGPGLAPDALDSMWAPFERLGVGERAIEATGLELTLARMFVEQMDGHISGVPDGTSGAGVLVDLRSATAEQAAP